MSYAQEMPGDALGLAAAVTSGQLDVGAPLERALARVAERDGDLNAFSEVLADSARRSVAEVRTRVRAGEYLPLAGVPVAVKDHVWVAGATSTMATAALAGFRAPVDARVVARLRRAGAIIVGKTTNPEYCLPATCASEVLGTTRNPWDPDRCPGASSGGSAVAVSAGIVPLALGTDALGSVRIPAAYCGTVGFKPSNGAVPSGPGFPEMGSLNTVGPLALSVADAALAHRVISGRPPVAAGALHHSLVRIGWATQLSGVVSASVAARFAEVVDMVASAGFQMAEVSPPRPDPGLAWDLLTAEMSPPPADLSTVADPGVRGMFERARAITAAEYLTWAGRRREYKEAWEDIFDVVDVLLTPTLGTGAYGAEATGMQTVDGVTFDVDLDPWWELVAPANLVGGPAVALPMGCSPEGMPISLQVQTRAGRDGECLAVASAIEAIVGPAELAPRFC